MNETIEFTGRAALLFCGSGPFDRDSNMPGQALNVGGALASTLTGHGMASLRYDDRGVGQSGGDYLTTVSTTRQAPRAPRWRRLAALPGNDANRLTVVGSRLREPVAAALLELIVVRTTTHSERPA